ncbi:MAG: hypothetical protein ACLR67_11995, partial [Eggerthella lenta]
LGAVRLRGFGEEEEVLIGLDRVERASSSACAARSRSISAAMRATSSQSIGMKRRHIHGSLLAFPLASSVAVRTTMRGYRAVSFA